MSTNLVMLDDELREQFKREGYAILPSILSADELETLRGELDRYIAEADAAMDAAGTDSMDITHRGKRYFINNKMLENEGMRDFVFGETMAQITRSFLSDNAFFFFEQFVVKFAEVGMSFSWHQDSGYLKQRIPNRDWNYITCWIALDDMTEENGTISVLPFPRGGYSGTVEHVREEGTNDLIGYTGDDPGELAIVPAGSIVVFHATLLHRSGANTTAKPRRSYIVEYSDEPVILLPGDHEPAFHTIPFLVDGERVG